MNACYISHKEGWRYPALNACYISIHTHHVPQSSGRMSVWRATLGMYTARGANIIRRCTSEKEAIPSAASPQATASLGRQRGRELSLSHPANDPPSPQALIAWTWVLITHVSGDIRPGRLLYLSQGRAAPPTRTMCLDPLVGCVWGATLA